MVEKGRQGGIKNSRGRENNNPDILYEKKFYLQSKERKKTQQAIT